MKVLKFLWHLPRLTFAFFVSIYQKTLSPDHGLFKVFYPHGFCKYKPSCSEYSMQSFLKYGFVLGFLKSVWRFLRCNPWSSGGYDEP